MFIIKAGTRRAFAFLLTLFLVAAPGYAGAQQIFRDTFTRPDGSTLGSPEIGGAWIKANEMTSQFIGSNGELRSPATIVLSAGALAFRYPNPFAYRPAMPYAYAPMKQKTQSATMSFMFRPSGGRVSHVVGLMNASDGFIYPYDNTIPPSDHFRYSPFTGIGLYIGRTGSAYGNSLVLIMKYQDGVPSRITNELYLPFQFEQGIPVALAFTIADDTMSVSVSNGQSTFSSSAPLLGFKPLVDQVFIYDEQHGEGDLSFDNVTVDKGNVRQVGLDIVPGTFPNVISRSSSDAITFAILGDSGFDAMLVDPKTIDLAGGKVKMAGQGGGYACTTQDVNQDGYVDLVCTIQIKRLDLVSGSDTAILEAKTYSGARVRGEDSVVVTP